MAVTVFHVANNERYRQNKKASRNNTPPQTNGLPVGSSDGEDYRNERE